MRVGLTRLMVCLGLRLRAMEDFKVHTKNTALYCAGVRGQFGVARGMQKQNGLAAISPGHRKKTINNLLERRVASGKHSKKCTTITACTSFQ